MSHCHLREDSTKVRQNFKLKLLTEFVLQLQIAICNKNGALELAINKPESAVIFCSKG